MNPIAKNLTAIKQQITRHEHHYGRKAQSVRLLAVSKTKPVTAIRQAYEAGQRDFGENYLDEALEKISGTDSLDCIWHFIGHIQSNKTRTIAENFAWVHTIDREKTAKRLSVQRPGNLQPLNCCIQVNIDEEARKSGVLVHELPSLLETVATLPRLNVRGLMVIPAVRDTLEEQRAVFSKVRIMFNELSLHYPEFDTLSMGMSADMEAAIAEGSTIVRIGTAIFGSR